VIPVIRREKTMLKKQGTLLFALMLTLLFGRCSLTKRRPDEAAKEARWEGRVIRMDKAASSLTVRKAGGTLEKTCVYDSSTKWVSQYHAIRRLPTLTRARSKKTTT